MKLKLSSALLIFVFLFVSCGGGLSQGGTGSVSIDAGRVAEYLARNAARTADIPSTAYKMRIVITTSGDYEGKAETTVSHNVTDTSISGMRPFFQKAYGTPVTIEDIPVGSTIKVKAALYLSQNIDADAYRQYLREHYQGISDDMITEMLQAVTLGNGVEMPWAEGVSDSFTVKEGENKVTIRLNGIDTSMFDEDEEIDVPIFLYAKGYESKTDIYVSSNGTKNILIEETSSFIKYCKDNNNYMYILYQKSNEEYGTDSYYVHSDNPVFPDVDFELDSAMAYNWDGMAYDSVENKMYFYFKDMDSNLKIMYFPNFISGASDADSVTYECNGFYISYIDAGVFAVNNNIAYVGRSYWGTQGVDECKVSGFDLSQGTTLNEDSAERILDWNKDDDDWLYINDSYCANGKLYLLVAKPMTDFEGGVDGRYGGIVCVNLQSKAAATYLAPEEYIISAYSEEYDSMNSIKLNQPMDTESKEAFFYPRKIIGIKPDRLIIADDGSFVYVGDANKPHFKNVNRVVMVNLDNFEITHVEEVEENFEGDGTIMICSATGFAQEGSIICDDD